MDNDFDELCRDLFKVFPSNAPDVVTDEGNDWGDYAEAQEAFAKFGSNWDCNAVFKNRSVIGFVNDAAYLFLLPRLVRCSLTDSGIDPDVFDYLVFALRDKTREYASLFSPEQKAALSSALRFLFGRVEDKWGIPEPTDNSTRIIMSALESDPSGREGQSHGLK